MRTQSLLSCLASASTLLLATTASGQVLVEPGIAQTGALHVGDNAYATLSDGGFVAFDGQVFARHDANGAQVQVYDTLPAPVFSSFVVIDDAELFAYAGESSNGDIFSIDLTAGSVTTLANLSFNFAMAFDATPGLAYVSASLGGFGFGNDIVRLDLANGVTSNLAHVAGPSGPLSCDDAGNLYFVTVYDGVNCPPPLKEQELVFWTDAQLDSGAPLTEADATVLTTDIDGSSSLLFDDHSQTLFLTNTNGDGFAQEILQVAASHGGVLGSVGEAYTWIQNLELWNTNDAVMAPYQPAGSTLFVNNIDFGDLTRDRVALEPLRAQATWTGPGSAGGPATVTVTAGVPGGSASIMLARSSFLSGSEHEFGLGNGLPGLLMVDTDDIWRRTQPLPLDANGDLTLDYTQPAGWSGALVFQALLYDENGSTSGTSSFVVNN